MKAAARVPVLLVLLMAAMACQGCQEVSAPECSAQSGELATYHAHQSSCSLYYRCQGGQRDVFSCAHGHHFDTQLQRCHLAGNVPCDTCHTPDTNLKQKSASEDCQPIPTCTLNKWNQKKPYPPDCTKYILCDIFGNSIISSCSLGNEFSPIDRICTLPDIANCPMCSDMQNHTSTVIVVPTTITTSMVLTTTSNGIGTCRDTPTCEPEMDWGVTKPYPPDCSKYIYCNKAGDELVTKCQADLHYSEFEGTCVNPVDANCPYCEPQINIVTSMPEIDRTICANIPTCIKELDWSKKKTYPPNCKQYIYCNIAGEGIITDCPINQQFSNSLLKCTTPTEANCLLCETLTTLPSILICPDTPTCIKELDWSKKKPFPPDCTKYIYCDISGAGILSDCPSGEHFSADSAKCFSSQLANCPLCDVITTTSTTVITTTTLPTCSPDSTCGPLDTGLNKPYPSNCEFYIYCLAENQSELRKCKAGLQFNPNVNRCQLPALAKCPICSS